MDLEFEKLFSIPLFALRVTGTIPDIPRDWKWVLKFIMMQAQFSFIGIFNMYDFIYVDFAAKDFNKACRTAILLINFLNITAKFVVLIKHRDVVKSIINTMKDELNDAKSLPDSEKEIVRKYAQKGNLVCKQWLFLCVFGILLFQLKCIFLNLYFLYIGSPRFVHLYDTTYTPNIEAKKDVWWVFIILYYFSSYYGVLSITMVIAFMPLGPVFMLHASGQLELAATRMESLFNDNPTDKEVKNRLKVIVISLQQTYDFVDKIETCLAVFYEMTLKVSSLTLPFTVFLLVETVKAGAVDIEFVSLTFSSIVTCAFPCYYGDLLTDKGESVRLATYCCGWERGSSRSARSTLLIILTRTLEPVAITTLFRTLSLDSLTDVFQQAYTIFNLMCAVWG